MAKKPTATWLVEEVADFLANSPSREDLLAYRPSAQAQERFNVLVAKSKTGSLSPDEEWELNQYQHLELLMQSVKSRSRSQRNSLQA
jgi:hypothetical protein